MVVKFGININININPLKTKGDSFCLNIQPVPRSKHNPFRLFNQLVNVIWGNNRCLCQDPHKYTVWEGRRISECET
jgi:hypothetical protein